MPDQENAAQGAVGEKQNNDHAFQWEAYPMGPVLRADDGGVVAQVLPPPHPHIPWEVWVYVNKMPIRLPRVVACEEAMAAAESWWSAAAKTAKELGL